MPVPGPRTQFGPLPGYRNPEAQSPHRFHEAPYVPTLELGRTPGTMERTLRGCVLAAGQVRMMYRQAVGYISAAEPSGWTTNGRDYLVPRPFGVTRALRYLARSFYVAGGTDNTRISELHTVVLPRVRSKPITVAGGSVRSRPTVRNRMSSFGSRVTPINEPAQGTEQ